MSPPPLHLAAEAGARRDAAVDALLAAEPWLDYANVPAIAARGGGAGALHRRWWQSAERVLVARDADDRPVAALRWGHRDFESRHFGLRMAKIDAPIAVADEALRRAAVRALADAACGRLRADGYRHAAASAATQDRATCWVLQELGGFHVGTRISWLAALTGAAEGPAPGDVRIERYEREAIATLPRAAWSRLHAWTVEGFDRGPFVFDLGVPSGRAAEIYQVWTEKALTGEWADVLLVARAGDEVVAFNAMRLLPDLSDAAGVGILGRGIGASLPGHRGLFTALQRACSALRPLGAGYLENETQSATLPTINVFGRLGHFCHRSTATFHFHLDRPAPGR